MRNRARFMLVLAAVLVTVASSAFADEAHCAPAADAQVEQVTAPPRLPGLAWDAGPGESPCRDCALPGCPPVACLATTVPEPSLLLLVPPPHLAWPWPRDTVIVPSRHHQPPTPPPNASSLSA